MRASQFWVYQVLILGLVVPLALLCDLRPSPLSVGFLLLAIAAMAYGRRMGRMGALFVAGLLLVFSGVGIVAGKAGTAPALLISLLGLLAEGLLVRDLMQLQNPLSHEDVCGECTRGQSSTTHQK